MASQLPMTIHEISRLRGQLKAKKRATTFMRRSSQYENRWEKAYQEQLARDILRFI